MRDLIQSITGCTPVIHAAGRTDRGVHAHQQVLSVTLPLRMPLSRFKSQLIAWTQVPDIRVRAVTEVDSKFHAQYSARYRTYRYYFSDQKLSAQDSRYIAYFPVFGYDISLLRNALSLIIGRRNCRAFCRSGASTRDYYRTIYSAQLLHLREHYCIEIQANGFLYGMVRRLIGAMLEVVYQRTSLYAFSTRFTWPVKSRYNYKPAPAHGLSLYRVAY